MTIRRIVAERLFEEYADGQYPYNDVQRNLGIELIAQAPDTKVVTRAIRSAFLAKNNPRLPELREALGSELTRHSSGGVYQPWHIPGCPGRCSQEGWVSDGGNAMARCPQGDRITKAEWISWLERNPDYMP